MRDFGKAVRTLLNSYFNEYGGGPSEAVEGLAGAIEVAATFRVPRLPWDAHFMLEAAVAATRSTCDRGPELLLDPGRHGVGAVFVRDKRIIAGGFNGSPPGQPHCDRLTCAVCGATFSISTPKVAGFVSGTPCLACREKGKEGILIGGHLIRDGHCVRTLHAEWNAIIQCALDGTSPAGATVYTTASPCWDCSKSLVRVGVARVVFGAAYESRYGLSSDAESLLRDADIEVERIDLRGYLRVGGGE
jgi:dCMP deaminase